MGTAASRILTAGLGLVAAVVMAEWASPARAHEVPAAVQVLGGGIMLDGLRPAAGGSCPGAYEVASDVPGGHVRCSHGPDEPPPGVDVAADVEPLVAPAAAPALECYGTGSDGPRVQAVYAVASDRTDRYDALLATVRQDAKNIDTIFANSAAATGGTRHVRFVTGAGCVADVSHVVLSPTGDDNFANTTNELNSRGFNRSDRKYLVWVDANVYCGIANINNDDRKVAANLNNSGPDYARADAGCWGGHTEAHELTHTLGGVQLSAPHTSGGYHCVDEYDVMCYSDSPNYPAMQYLCTPSSYESLLDCNHDDYFHTNPPAGNYLATHWNAADNAFLAAASGGDDRGPPDIHADVGPAPPPESAVQGPLFSVLAAPREPSRHRGPLAALALAAWARRVDDACHPP
ncbi:MAG: hypothetical protein U0U69_08085 [Acidimicrobiia bacterium]